MNMGCLCEHGAFVKVTFRSPLPRDCLWARGMDTHHAAVTVLYRVHSFQIQKFNLNFKIHFNFKKFIFKFKKVYF